MTTVEATKGSLSLRSGQSRDARRYLQLALAAIWLLDGILQYQPFMFTKDFATQILAPTAQGNPGWIADSVTWSARLVAAHPVGLNTIFATIQVLLGLGIALRGTLKPALVASIVWSALVWWFGEGLGGLLTGSASALMGAPGAALLYTVLAVLLWPSRKPAPFIAARPIGRFGAKLVWLVLWGGLAVLSLQPANLGQQALSSMVAGMSVGQPSWLAAIMNAFAGFSAHHGTGLTLAGAGILALIGLGMFLPRPAVKVTVVAALIVSAFIWVIGEALGGVIAGQGTDPNTGPLLALLACAYWPTAVSTDLTVDEETDVR